MEIWFRSLDRIPAQEVWVLREVSAFVEIASQADRKIVLVQTDQLERNQHRHSPAEDSVLDGYLFSVERAVPLTLASREGESIVLLTLLVLFAASSEPMHVSSKL